MFKNSIKIALRNLWNSKIYSLINTIGLSVGLTVFVLVLLYVNYENQYDDWNPKLKEVYRVGVSEQDKDGLKMFSSIQYPLGTFLAEQCPEVKTVSRVRALHGESLITTDKDEFYELKVINADSNFFAVFPYQFVQGDAQNALSLPNSAVITNEMSQKLFGKSDAIGKTIKYNNGELYTVTGIIEKQGPSHLDFNICLSNHSTRFSNNWFMKNYDTYVVLKPNASIESLHQKVLSDYEKQYAISFFPAGKDGVKDVLKELSEKHGVSNLDVFFESVSEIHLQPKGFQEWSAISPIYDFNPSNRLPIIIFSFLGILVLLLACINYTNMAIAHSSKRMKESGIRKVLGAGRAQLILQFLVETFIQCLLAIILALFLIVLIKGVLNTTFQLDLRLWNTINPQQNTLFTIQLISVVIALAFVSGLYPAFILTAYRPVKILKDDVTKSIKGNWLRNGLVVLQYSIATCFIISMFIISMQLNFMHGNDPGFNTEQVLRIQAVNTSQLFPGQEGDRSEEIINRLGQISGVKEVSTGQSYPGAVSTGTQEASFDGNNILPMQFSLINFNFFKTLGMEIIKGRDFSPLFSRDTADAAVINETAARQMGWKDPIGKSVDIVGKKYQVIGVLKDNYMSGYENEILPQIYMMGVNVPDNFLGHNNVLIKLDGRQSKEALKEIVTFWKTIEPEFPVRYSWLNDDFSRLTEKYERFGKLTGYLTLSALAIAVMGIFALSAFAAEQRRKEIGVRKVLGATIYSITKLVSKDFVKLVLIAILIASPIAWWAMNKWLQDFAYHIEIQWWMFMVAAVLSIFIALFTVSFQAIKAAVANPVDSLRDE